MESRKIMRSLTKVGGRVAMVASGVGKAVLATYADEDVNAIICQQRMPRLTEKSIMRPSDLFRELETIRRQVTPSTTRKPASACAASASWCSTIAPNHWPRVPALGREVREVAAELTVALGGVMQAEKAG